MIWSQEDRRNRLSHLIVALLFAAAPGVAGDLESWNQVGLTMAERSGASWQVFGSFRVREGLREVYDARGGTQVSWTLLPRTNLTAGYLLRGLRPPGSAFSAEHRLFVGPAVLLTKRVLTVIANTQYERLLRADGRRDFNRYRQRFDLERVRPGPSPFVNEELFFVREGFVRSRSRAGLRWKFPSGSRLEIAYQFQTDRTNGAWGPLHAIVTSINFRRPG